MKTQILVLLLCFCATQMFYSQDEDGVVSLNIPVRNSLTFNRYAINPTFSFVREQNKYISIYNKREWVQFDDAPLTYLASYTGRFAENIGGGIGVFQKNYGVLSTFGGILNFAYNTRLTRDNNLTFGLNVGAYKSGVNTGNVITNFDDPSLQNVPENFMITINPGINFGLEFLDFGVSFNNLVAYNFKSSTLVEENPESGIQAHIMYTGYMNSRGFFDESKFSGLIRSEFIKEETIVSALAMLTVPKGIWAQVGYNTVYGISGGLGLNITPQIAIEYNFENAIGDLTEFGSSHDITIAYRFKNNQSYYYSSGDEVSGLITKSSGRKSSKSKQSKVQANANRKLATERKAEAKAKLLAEQKAKEKAEAQAKLLAEQKAKEEITKPTDKLGKAMYALTQQAEESKARQDELFTEIDDIVAIKSQDLKDLKQENDLSEQGIAVEPKPFKSITEENIRLKKMIADLDNVIDYRKLVIKELKKLYKDKYENEKVNDTIYLDEVYMFYNRTLDRLTAEQIEATQAQIKLQLELKNIQEATEFERNRRIKRALYNNEEERYSIDRATLKSIKNSTPQGQVFNAEDYDFGEEQSSNIQILKNIDHVDSGYYMILAVHSDTQKRNDFIAKVYASGRSDVDFFYDVKTSKYYIYYDKFDSIKEANEALKSKGNRPYNIKMSLVKIEN